MAWPYPYTGHTAAEFPMNIHGGGSIPSYLLQPHNQWDELFKRIAPAIKDYLQQKKSDEIANQLMNMESARRAEPVMNNGQPVSGGPGMDASQVATFNTSLGFPGTYKTPERGGQQAYQAQKLYQDYVSKQQADQSQSMNDYWQNKVREAQMNKYNADANAPDDRVEITLPDGRKTKVTPNEAAQYMKPRAGQQDSIEAIDRDAVAWTGHHLSDLINPTNKDARNNPDGSATITLADDKKVTIPADALRSFRDRYARIQTPGSQMFQQYQQQITAPDLPAVTEPPPTTAPAPKQLDDGTARSILAETGGDKDKARKLARQRGYIWQ